MTQRFSMSRVRVFNRFFANVLFVGLLTVLASCITIEKEVKPDPEAIALQNKLKALRGGEYRAAQPSSSFKGETAEAYRIASDVPELIDSLNCYCGCKKKHNHKSLMTCYIDSHASKCKICRKQALRAYDLHKKGEDFLTIRETIDREFAPN